MTQVGPIFSAMEKYISDNRAAIAAGANIDLTTLDEQIEVLCNLILNLSAEDQKLYEPRLQDLLGGLNALGLELREQHAVHELPKHRNASVAYKTADSRDNFGKRDEDKK